MMMMAMLSCGGYRLVPDAGDCSKRRSLELVPWISASSKTARKHPHYHACHCHQGNWTGHSNNSTSSDISSTQSATVLGKRFKTHLFSRSLPKSRGVAVHWPLHFGRSFYFYLHTHRTSFLSTINGWRHSEAIRLISTRLFYDTLCTYSIIIGFFTLMFVSLPVFFCICMFYQCVGE